MPPERADAIAATSDSSASLATRFIPASSLRSLRLPTAFVPGCAGIPRDAVVGSARVPATMGGLAPRAGDGAPMTTDETMASEATSATAAVARRAGLDIGRLPLRMIGLTPL